VFEGGVKIAKGAVDIADMVERSRKKDGSDNGNFDDLRNSQEGQLNRVTQEQRRQNSGLMGAIDGQVQQLDDLVQEQRRQGQVTVGLLGNLSTTVKTNIEEVNKLFLYLSNYNIYEYV
jgi:hypothetical protein